MSLKLVYEPLKIKGLEIPNRIARSAHGTNLTNYGAITDRLIDYHVARAKGGVGLTILEAATVHPTRSEEHTSEFQSLMRIPYAVLFLTKNINRHSLHQTQLGNLH